MPAETTIQTQADADEKMVNLPSEGAGVDVEVKDAPTIVNSETDETIDVGEKSIEGAVASATEVEDYGKKVQSRIDKLKKKNYVNRKDAKRQPLTTPKVYKGMPASFETGHGGWTPAMLVSLRRVWKRKQTRLKRP